METTDVIICGCGPTGAMLSAQLGRHAVQHIVLERDEVVNEDPRGIALDEDGIRHLQACGIYDKIFTEIGQCMGRFNFIDGVHSNLSQQPFMYHHYSTTEGGTGHPGFICHKQPAIEYHLRAVINASTAGQLRLGSTVTSVREDDEWVYVEYTNASGEIKQVRGRFLVGADGKTGFTRKMYLEPRGVHLERVSDLVDEQVWVALNWRMTLPTPETHPDWPLWSKGYSPQQAYDWFFPPDFRFLCNPKRPAVCGRFGLPEDRLWRFEFVVSPHEDGQVMAGPDKIREIVFPYITHPGTAYGLPATTQVQYPEDCIEVLRSRPFTFAARSCNTWARERVILCGDAAHVFPPFGGQGITSGFRDAISLAWRLALTTKEPNGADYRKLLMGWYLERKQQLDKSLKSTIENGSYVTQANPVKIFCRNWYVWALKLVPEWKHWLEMGSRREGMCRYRFEPGSGMAFLPDLGGGNNFPQVYCTDTRQQNSRSSVYFTDDVIFQPSKRGLFQIVVLVPSVADLPRYRILLSSVSDLVSLDNPIIDEATFILLDTETPSISQAEQRGLYRLATAEEFSAEKVLSDRRPEPQCYDPYRISKEVGGKPFIILRPDRFVFAACDDMESLARAARGLAVLAKGVL